MKTFFANLKEKYGKTKLIVFIVAIILAIIIIPTGINAIVHKESPKEMISDVFTSTSNKIVGKWQGDNAVTAFEFNEDGKYISYISTFSYEGRYTIKGNKLTLKNSDLDGSVEYKVSINGNRLELKLISENGIDPEEKTKTSFTKVDTIKMQSISDILDDLKETDKK